MIFKSSFHFKWSNRAICALCTKLIFFIMPFSERNEPKQE